MIDRDDVLAGYRMILGREAESEETITYHCQHESVTSFRKVLLESDEFQSFHDSVLSAGKRIPFPDSQDLAAERLVFLHIPKTGGTTFHHLLVEGYAPSEICPERFNDLKKHTMGTLAKYRLFSGHFDIVSTEMLPGRKRFITFLREPVARLLSLYNFLRAHNADVIERNEWGLAELAAGLPADEFFSHPEVRRHPYVENGMTRLLTVALPLENWSSLYQGEALVSVAGRADEALQRLESMAAFGILERYDESVALIFQALGRKPPQQYESRMVLKELVNAPANYHPVDVARETPELRAILDDLVNEDVRLYQGARELFEARWARR